MLQNLSSLGSATAGFICIIALAPISCTDLTIKLPAVEGMRTQAESGKEGDSQKLDASVARDTQGQEGAKVEGLQASSKESGAADSGAATSNGDEGMKVTPPSAFSQPLPDLTVDW